MTRDEFVERIRRGASAFEEHERAARLGGHGIGVVGLTPFDWDGRVKLDMAGYWKWKATCRCGGVRYQAKGRSPSMKEGKAACTAAIMLLAQATIRELP